MLCRLVLQQSWVPGMNGAPQTQENHSAWCSELDVSCVQTSLPVYAVSMLLKYMLLECIPLIALHANRCACLLGGADAHSSNASKHQKQISTEVKAASTGTGTDRHSRRGHSHAQGQNKCQVWLRRTRICCCVSEVMTVYRHSA